MAHRSWLCRAMKVPIFVPPVLILVNIYALLIGQRNSLTDLDDPIIRELHNIKSLQEGVSKVIVDEEMLKLKKINDERLTHVEEMCAKYDTDPKFREDPLTGEAIATSDRSLIYCIMPKVACTNWKRIFRYINHDYEGEVGGPEDIPRVYVHFGPFNNTPVLPLKNKTIVEEINKTGFKFMISRDPYARLWSGYLDKLFLPDFWWWLGTKIINETRPDASERSRRCGHDVTFSEFLQYTAMNLKRRKHVDMHFEPVYRRCNPCRIKYDAISKIETLKYDSKIIMSEVEKHHRMRRSAVTLDKQDPGTEEIEMLTGYNYDIQTRLILLGNRSECYNQVEIAFRLWKTFQFNGYLGDDIEFPAEELEKLNNDRELIKNAMISKLLGIRKSKPNDVLESWKDQRTKYLMKAYENLPRYIVLGIKHTFAKDFELFQYEKEPDYIYHR